MGLKEHEVERDKFEFDDEGPGFEFPCIVCKHRNVRDSEEPCMTCDHNLNAKPEVPQCQQTPSR